jgi:PAS domain-containing protein
MSPFDPVAVDPAAWALQAERDRLVAELEALRAPQVSAAVAQLQAEVAQLRAEVERLRAPPRPTTPVPARSEARPPTLTYAPPLPSPFEPDVGPLRPGARVPRDVPLHDTQAGLDFAALGRLTPEALDGLPYGLITLDALGRVVHYNDTESRLAGLAPGQVIGRHFFTEVAPCARCASSRGASSSWPRTRRGSACRPSTSCSGSPATRST